MTITASDILSVTESVTKEWTRQRKAEERGRSKSLRAYVYSDRVDFTEVADDIIPAGYAHASNNGQYSVSKRQVYYSCRDQFRSETGREIDSKYFCQNILVKYLNRHPGKTAGWKITADPRGALNVPNGTYRVRVPCGTLEIDAHLQEARKQIDYADFDPSIAVEWPSIGPGQRYQAVLYIEKEGFEPLLEEARIAERFDIAIISCKGQSVVAARKFVDHVCHVGGGVPLLIAHDFDKAGGEISKCLTEVSYWAREQGLVKYEFKNKIDARDIGLRLADVKKYHLKHERCRFKGKFRRGCLYNEEERDFLRASARVELNAFSSSQFIEWLESKLTEQLGTKRFIPGDDEVLENAYRRALAVAKINKVLEREVEGAKEMAAEAKVPKTLRRQLAKRLQDSKGAWDKALYTMAETMVLREDDD